MKKLAMLAAVFLLFATSQTAQAGCGSVVYFDSGTPPDSGGVIPVGGLPPVPGSKTDLTPDFDIYNEAGDEISANSNDAPIGTVYVGQRIRLNLETEVSNDDVKYHLRDSDSDSIEGPVYYWIDGAVSKTLYVSEEFDVDDLDEGDSPDEEEWFTVPNYPGKILSFQAEVDGDDEVDEESESNNTSRVERFVINYGVTSTGKRWDQLTQGEQSAIMQIIFN